jgi:type I restriction enzyme S subunit
MDGFAGAIGVSDSEGKCSPVCSVCVPRAAREVHVPFYGYLVRQLAVTDFILSLAKGIRERSTEFRYSELSNLALPLPEIAEQIQITQFLDYETAKIDALIEKQQQLIALLKEKRQAVISHAVTKGLNPNAPLRESGVEWLGMVPEHWFSTRLKFHARKIVDGAHFTPTYVENGVPFLRVTDIQTYPMNQEGVKYIPKQEHRELMKRCNPEIGDLLLSKNGTIGVPRVVDWEWEFSIFVSLCLIKPQDSLNVRFLYYVFLSHQIREQISALIKQSTVINLHLDKIANFALSLPPLNEQDQVVQFLDAEVARQGEVLAGSEAAVELLQERRTALISAAVTGKIDVRNWAPPDSEAEQDVA